MVVCGPAKSKVVVQIHSQSGFLMKMVNMSYLGCEFYGFESHESHLFNTYFLRIYIFIRITYIFMFFSPLEQFDTVHLFKLSFFGYIDISFTSILIPLVIVLLFMGVIYLFIFPFFNLIPNF